MQAPDFIGDMFRLGIKHRPIRHVVKAFVAQDRVGLILATHSLALVAGEAFVAEMGVLVHVIAFP